MEYSSRYALRRGRSFLSVMEGCGPQFPSMHGTKNHTACGGELCTTIPSMLRALPARLASGRSTVPGLALLVQVRGGAEGLRLATKLRYPATEASSRQPCVLKPTAAAGCSGF
jgi:hypothetical protein